MKMLTVLFIFTLWAGNALASDGVMVSSDTRGDTVTANIAKDGLFFECLLYPRGEMISLKIIIKNTRRRGDAIDYTIYFREGKAQSIIYSFYGANNDYQTETYDGDKKVYKELFILAEKFVRKMSKDYNLPKLAREESARKRVEVKQAEEEQKRKEAERAKFRPNPTVILEKILKNK